MKISDHGLDLGGSGEDIGGPTDELHPFTKSSETGLDSTALPRGIGPVSICVYY